MKVRLTENFHAGPGLLAPPDTVLRRTDVIPGLLPGHRVEGELLPVLGSGCLALPPPHRPAGRVGAGEAGQAEGTSPGL